MLRSFLAKRGIFLSSKNAEWSKLRKEILCPCDEQREIYTFSFCMVRVLVVSWPSEGIQRRKPKILY